MNKHFNFHRILLRGSFKLGDCYLNSFQSCGNSIIPSFFTHHSLTRIFCHGSTLSMQSQSFYQIKRFSIATSLDNNHKIKYICSNRQKKLNQYSQNDIDTYFTKKLLQDYWKDDVISIMTIVSKSNNRLSIDKHLPKITEFLKISSERFKSGDVSAIIYALGNIINVNNESKVYDELIFEIIKKLNQTIKRFTIINISSILFGLKSMKCSSIAVSQLLLALIPKIEACSDCFNPQAVSNALYGFQNMNSDSMEAKKLLNVLIPKIESCNQPFVAQCVSNALYGLQNMNSDSMEVRSILKALIPKIESCNELLNAQAVGNSLYGLKNMNSDTIEVQNMLKALIPKIESCNELLNAQVVGNSLYGLQNMKNNNIEVQNIFKILIPKIIKCNEPLSAHALTTSLYSLQNMKTIPAELLQYIEQELLNFLINMKKSTADLSALNGICLYQSIILCCSNHIQLTHISSIYNQLSLTGQHTINELKNILQEYLNGPEMVLFLQSQLVNKIESTHVKLIEQQLLLKYPIEFQKKQAHIEKNIFLYGFECDLIFRYKKLLINFEIDGSIHLKYSKRLFCQKRDEYLEKVHNVKVIRYDVLSKSNKLIWQRS